MTKKKSKPEETNENQGIVFSEQFDSYEQFIMEKTTEWYGLCQSLDALDDLSGNDEKSIKKLIAARRPIAGVIRETLEELVFVFEAMMTEGLLGGEDEG